MCSESLTLLADDPVIAYPGSPDASPVVDSVSLEYDGVGRMQRKKIPHLGVEESFVHDDIGRLLRSELSRDGEATVAMGAPGFTDRFGAEPSGWVNPSDGDALRPSECDCRRFSDLRLAISNGRECFDRNGVGLTWRSVVEAGRRVPTGEESSMRSSRTMADGSKASPGRVRPDPDRDVLRGWLLRT